jgi:amino acid adenylation domain-containing protein
VDAERRGLIAAMHAYLGERLPEFMLPSAFVVLEALPLTSSGKVDRRSLPAPGVDDHLFEAYVGPRDGLESLLAERWAQLLGVDRVGRDDNFFALGGHSLLVMRLGSRLRRELGVTLPASALFAHPTLAAFAAQVAGLERSGLPPIRPVARHESLLPSFAQQRLWFLAQLDAQSATYHVPVAWRLRGALDRTALRGSLDRVLARHEALRAVFHSVDGLPRVRLLAADTHVPFVEHDLRGERDAAGRLQSLMREEAHARFDLATEPSMRARLIRLQDDEHVLVATLHHIATDGWSMKLLLRELGGFYADAEPAPLEIQYFDYAAWQHQWLTDAHLQPQLAYWCETLRDAPSLLALPTDRPRPAQQSFEGASLPVQLDATLSQALRQFARHRGCTPFVVLMAAWASVLGRLSGQDDVVIGTPTANRQDLDVEPLIGFFVNSLPLRVDLSGEPDVATLVARVHALTLAAHEHADVAFERIVEVAQPVRRADCTPLFQVSFAWQSNEAGRLALPGLHIETIDTGYEAAKFDLELDLADGVEGISGHLRYATALFDAATIERYRGYLVTLLQAMVEDDARGITRPIARIELLSCAERTLQLDTWNANETAFPATQCVHQVFEQQARRAPDAPAVIDGARTFAFGELNMLANRIAHRLIARGVRPGDRVFLLLERGLPLVASELAILKVGAAYVPANAQTPAARLAWMVEDSEAVLVLNDDGIAIAGTSATTLAVGVLMAESGVEGNPELVLSAELAAYVMYTSGSTGTPKGVLIPHRGLTRLAINNTFAHYAPGDRVSFCSNPAFDASALDLWPTLLNGATVVVIDQSTLLSTDAFVAMLKRTRVDTLWLTIGLFQQMVTALAPIMSQFKAVMTGGDVLDPAKMAEAFAAGPGRLVAAYGPTETSVFTTTYLIERAEPARPVSIGRPIANTRLYLLDAYGQPVPIGAPGEIHIGGAAVGLGYLNRPELTAERFVDDPFNPIPGQRMYRSGDFGRYRADGNIEFLRRNDGQVKLRGFRVELGEIEMRLGEHADVESAAVIVREETPGDKQLAAYVTLAPAAQPHGLAARLRRHLEEILPDYMVPSSYVRLGELPLTPNGKLDRQALPAPGEDDFAREAYVAPQGRVEEAVAALWAELLEVERVSRFDNFFALGGHSLLAVKILSQVNARFQVSLTIDAIFNAPTVAQLAALIGAGQATQPAPGRLSTPIPRVARRRPV